MIVGASTLYALVKKSEPTAARELARAGFSVIELSFEYPHFFSRSDIAALKKLSREFGLSYSMHFPWSVISLTHPWREYRKWQSRLLQKAFHAAQALDVTHCIVHGGRFYSLASLGLSDEKMLDYCISELAPLAEAAGRNGMRVVAENCLTPDAFGEPQRLRYVLDRVPELGFCLDVAHAVITRQVRELKKLSPQHVHASDNNLCKDEHLAIGDGKIDWRAWVEFLKKKGFKEKIVLECDSVRALMRSRNALNKLV